MLGWGDLHQLSLTPQDQVRWIQEEVLDWVRQGFLRKGEAARLAALLEEGIARLTRKNVGGAIQQLRDFQTGLGAYVRAELLPQAEAEGMAEAAEDLILILSD